MPSKDPWAISAERRKIMAKFLKKPKTAKQIAKRLGIEVNKVYRAIYLMGDCIQTEKAKSKKSGRWVTYYSIRPGKKPPMPPSRSETSLWVHSVRKKMKAFPDNSTR